MKHLLTVEGFEGTLDDLARVIGNMRYDKAKEFIELLADDFKKQADSDKSKGKVRLANQMYQVVEKLYEARDNMEKVWEICKPYMEK